MRYGILKISDTNYPTIQTIAGNMFSLTVNSEVEMDQGDKILGYWSTNPKRFIMVLEVAKKSSLDKVFLSKIFEIPSGVEIKETDFQTKINVKFSNNKNLIEVTEEEYFSYEQKLLSLIGLGKSTEKSFVKDIEKPYNRIIFGAPGTGKSKRLADESTIFKNTLQPKTDLDKIKIEFANVKSDENFIPQCAAIGFVYAKQILSMKNDEINKLLQDFNPPQNVGYYIKTGAQVSEFFNLSESNGDLLYEECPDLIKQAYNTIDTKKNKVPQMYAIGLKFSDFISSEFENNSPKNQINMLLGLESEHINGYYITTGSQTLKFIKKLNNTDIKTYEEKTIERVTFHPNYSYAQFVGTYKPVQDINNDENIRYEYVPGPFMRIYVSAKNNPTQNFLLLIEEINRANVAAVFGDVFQLLDRNKEGNSEYPITISEDMKKYLNRNGIAEDELSIPSNMYIWATMNSADQGVFPMDTAFKRRWEFEYIGIDDNEEKLKNSKNEPFYIPICKDRKVSQKIKWNDLRKAINNKLISLGINEDKLLGPFFLSKSVLESAMEKGINFVKLFESKVLMYLFEDAAKMKAKSLFNVDKYIYSEVCKKFEKDGLDVFIFNNEDNVSFEDIKSEPPSNGELF